MKYETNPLMDEFAVRVMTAIMNNSGITALKLANKTKIAQATVYRIIGSLDAAGWLDKTTKKPGRFGGNSTVMLSAKHKAIAVICTKAGSHISTVPA